MSHLETVTITSPPVNVVMGYDSPAGLGHLVSLSVHR